MKILILNFIFLICLLCFNFGKLPLAHAIIKGTEIYDLNSKSPQQSAYVALSFSLKGLPADPCSGTYLGKGKILTAAHCFLINEFPTEDPEICIEDFIKTQKLCIHKSDYAVFFPPVLEQGGKAPTRKYRTVIRIPKPDLAIIVINENLRSQMPSFKEIDIIQSGAVVFDLSLQKFKIIGQGCTDYIVPVLEAPKGMGVFRSGEVVLDPLTVTELEYQSIWNPDNGNAGACWGDSGGALVSMGLENKETQIGVISSMKTKHNHQTGLPNLVTSSYSRMDHPKVQEWLKTVIN